MNKRSAMLMAAGLVLTLIVGGVAMSVGLTGPTPSEAAPRAQRRTTTAAPIVKTVKHTLVVHTRGGTSPSTTTGPSGTTGPGSRSSDDHSGHGDDDGDTDDHSGHGGHGDDDGDTDDHSGHGGDGDHHGDDDHGHNDDHNGSDDRRAS